MSRLINNDLKSFIKYNYFPIILFFILTFSNFWIYWIYEFNFLIGEILIILTLLLYLSLNLKNSKITLITFSLLVILSLFLIFSYFNKNLFSISQTDLIRTEQRKNFYANELGKIYRNRFGIFYFDKLRLNLSKIQEAFFTPMEWSLYFSPRRFKDYEKFSFFLSPFFIIGLLNFIINSTKKIIIYFFIALTVHTFTTLNSNVSPLLFFPLLIVCIDQGIIISLRRIKQLFHLI